MRFLSFQLETFMKHFFSFTVYVCVKKKNYNSMKKKMAKKIIYKMLRLMEELNISSFKCFALIISII